MFTGLFPAEAGPTKKHRAHPVGLAARDPCGAGFSREGVGRHRRGIEGVHTGLFPAEAGPTKKHDVHSAGLAERDLCGTGFSREGVGRHAAELRVFTQASSRLKPVPLKSVACIQWNWLDATHVGLGLAGKASGGMLRD